MNIVYILHHSYTLDQEEETKLIGTYSSEQEAKEAIDRLVLQPGFKDRPNDFHISKYKINKDHWTEGYITV